jgi:hypothetical protein
MSVEEMARKTRRAWAHMRENKEAPIANRGNGPDRGAGRHRLNPYTIALIVVIVVLCILYTYFFFAYHLPLRVAGSDTYSHLGILRCVRDQLGFDENLTPDMFPYLYRGNYRNGINYVIMAVISAFPGISNISTLYIFGLLGITVLFSGLYFMVWSLFASHRVAFIAALLSLVICSFDSTVMRSPYSFANILTNAHYASILSLGIALILIALNVRFLTTGSWKHYLLQVILSALVLNIHVLTGLQYFLILVILVTVYAFRDRHFTKRHFLLLSLIPATLALVTLWPLYHWYGMFTEASINVGSSKTPHTSVVEFLDRSVLFFIGLPFLISLKKERLFLLIWTVAFAVISLSFLTRVNVPYFWRFASIMYIPLIIGLALGLGADVWKLKRWKMVAVPVILVIIAAFIGTSLWRTALRFQAILEKSAYEKWEAFAPYAEGGDHLLALPSPSYILMGISEYNVATVAAGHAPPKIINDRNLTLTEAFFNTNFSIWEELLKEYDAEQVLVPRYQPFSDLHFLLNGVRLANNPWADLYLVDPDQLDTAVYQEVVDPELEQGSLEGTYARFTYWADVQARIRSNITLQRVADTGDQGDFFLRAESEDPMGNLLFMNRGFIEIEPGKSYRVTASVRKVEGDPRVFIAVYQYAEPSFESVLEKGYLKAPVTSEDWQLINKSIRPINTKNPIFVLSPDTRYIKIGLSLLSSSTGIVDVDSISLVPVDKP